jgi:hypothetical protein
MKVLGGRITNKTGSFLRPFMSGGWSGNANSITEDGACAESRGLTIALVVVWCSEVSNSEAELRDADKDVESWRIAGGGSGVGRLVIEILGLWG